MNPNDILVIFLISCVYVVCTIYTDLRLNASNFIRRNKRFRSTRSSLDCICLWTEEAIISYVTMSLFLNCSKTLTKVVACVATIDVLTSHFDRYWFLFLLSNTAFETHVLVHLIDVKEEIDSYKERGTRLETV